MVNPHFECKVVFPTQSQIRKTEWWTSIAVNSSNLWSCYISNTEVSYSVTCSMYWHDVILV